jgi:hypothetical protein
MQSVDPRAPPPRATALLWQAIKRDAGARRPLS